MALREMGRVANEIDADLLVMGLATPRNFPKNFWAALQLA
jgi:hypothetical protein